MKVQIDTRKRFLTHALHGGSDIDEQMYRRAKIVVHRLIGEDLPLDRGGYRQLGQVFQRLRYEDWLLDLFAVDDRVAGQLPKWEDILRGLAVACWIGVDGGGIDGTVRDLRKQFDGVPAASTIRGWIKKYPVFAKQFDALKEDEDLARWFIEEHDIPRPFSWDS